MDDRLQQLIALGREHYNAGEYEKAEPFLGQVVQEHRPSFADIYNMLGVIYHAQGRFADAEEAFETALRINPSYTEAALNLSVTYNDRGKYDQAREVYAAAVSASHQQPSSLDPFARGKLANMHADLGAGVRRPRDVRRRRARAPARRSTCARASSTSASGSATCTATWATPRRRSPSSSTSSRSSPTTSPPAWPSASRCSRSAGATRRSPSGRSILEVEPGRAPCRRLPPHGARPGQRSGGRQRPRRRPVPPASGLSVPDRRLAAVARALRGSGAQVREVRERRARLPARARAADQGTLRAE